MVRKIVLTHNLGDQTVGQFAETDGLGTDATLNEAIEYGFVTSIQKESLLAYVQGVFKAMIKGIESDGNGRPDRRHRRVRRLDRRWRYVAHQRARFARSVRQGRDVHQEQ